MKEIMEGGYKYILLSPEDNCLICNTKRINMCFSWNIFHGEATSSCCGAVYQLKDYGISEPNEAQKELLEDLKGDYIEFCIKSDWIEPLQKAIKQTGIQDINNTEVLSVAEEIKKAQTSD